MYFFKASLIHFRNKDKSHLKLLFCCAIIFIQLLFKRKRNIGYNWGILLHTLAGSSSSISKITSCTLCPQKNYYNKCSSLYIEG